MLSRKWIIADPHLGHRKTWSEFTHHKTGEPLRPFSSTEEMDDFMIAQWNERVGAEDVTYVLGDVALRPEFLPLLNEMRGHKILVRGNHDQELAEHYLKFFKDVVGIVVLKGIALTHVPIHPGSLARWIGNIHGHTHDRVVLRDDGQPDSRYVCVSVEQQNFAPRPLLEVIEQVREGAEYYRRQYGAGPLDATISSGAG